MNKKFILTQVSSRLHESHHTWWLAEDIEPWTFFAVVNIEDET